jgi:hypothetical protein
MARCAEVAPVWADGSRKPRMDEEPLFVLICDLDETHLPTLCHDKSVGIWWTTEDPQDLPDEPGGETGD